MRNKKFLTLALMMAVTALTVAETTNTVVAKSHHHTCKIEAAAEADTTEEVTEEVTEEAPVETKSDAEKAALIEKCKSLTPFTYANDEVPESRLMIVETKTGVNIYQEYAYIDYDQEVVDEDNKDETYYNATINNPQDMELIYSTDGNEDLTDIHVVCEVGVFKIAGEELRQEGYKGFETIDLINGIEGDDFDLDSSYFKVAALNREEGCLNGKITCTNPYSKIKYNYGEGLYGGGYVFYSQFEENSQYVDCTVGYDISVNPDKTINLTIGGYNEDENFASTVEYTLSPSNIAYTAQ